MNFLDSGLRRNDKIERVHLFKVSLERMRAMRAQTVAPGCTSCVSPSSPPSMLSRGSKRLPKASR